MGKVTKFLSETTGVSIGLAIMIGSYLVTVEVRVYANTILRERAEDALKKAETVIERIDRRLSRIEGALKIKEEKEE